MASDPSVCWAEGMEVKPDGSAVAAGPVQAAPPLGLWRRLRTVALLVRWLGFWPLEEGPDGLPRPSAGRRRLLPLALFAAHLLLFAVLGVITFVSNVVFAGGTSVIRSYGGGSGTSQVAMGALMLAGTLCWLLLPPALHGQRRRLSRLLVRWGRLEAEAAAAAGRPSAADWLVPTAYVGLMITFQMLSWTSSNRQMNIVQSSLVVTVLANVWRVHLSLMWQTSVLLPLVILCQGAGELRRQTRWLAAELRQPQSDSQLRRLARIYNECCALSELLSSSLSPVTLTSCVILNISTVVMFYQTVAYYIARTAADPSGDNVTMLVCGAATYCLVISLQAVVYGACQRAADSGAEARRRLKQAAAEPRRQIRLALDHIQLTASGFFTLDKPAAFQQAYNLLGLTVILIQFAQGESGTPSTKPP